MGELKRLASMLPHLSKLRFSVDRKWRGLCTASVDLTEGQPLLSLCDTSELHCEADLQCSQLACSNKTRSNCASCAANIICVPLLSCTGKPIRNAANCCIACLCNTRS